MINLLRNILRFLAFYTIIIGVSHTTVYAQFVNVDLEIDPEIKAVVINPIEFPEVVINSGRVSIGLGEPTMGVFGITAFSTQTISIQITYPDYLSSNSGSENDRIPIEINSYYNNRGNNDYRSALPLENNTGVISILDSEEYLKNPNSYWETLYIYLVGAINVGNISEGNYFGDIQLVVEYQ